MACASRVLRAAHLRQSPPLLPGGRRAPAAASHRAQCRSPGVHRRSHQLPPVTTAGWGTYGAGSAEGELAGWRAGGALGRAGSQPTLAWQLAGAGCSRQGWSNESRRRRQEAPPNWRWQEQAPPVPPLTTSASSSLAAAMLLARLVVDGSGPRLCASTSSAPQEAWDAVWMNALSCGVSSTSASIARGKPRKARVPQARHSARSAEQALVQQLKARSVPGRGAGRVMALHGSVSAAALPAAPSLSCTALPCDTHKQPHWIVQPLWRRLGQRKLCSWLALPPPEQWACAPQLAGPCSQRFGRSDGECRTSWRCRHCSCSRRRCRLQPSRSLAARLRPTPARHLPCFCACSAPAAPLRSAQQHHAASRPAAAAAARAQRLAVRAAAAAASGGLQALIFDCDGE